MSASLVLVRHGQSEWNEKNLFTGWKDPGLTAKGVEEAKSAGIQSVSYTHLRAHETPEHLVCRLLLEKKKRKKKKKKTLHK